MKKTRRKIDAALKGKSRWRRHENRRLWPDLAQRYQVHPNQIYAWKKQLKGQAAPGVRPEGQPGGRGPDGA